MKRFVFLAALMLLSSTADAGTFSFMVRGHRVRVEAPRYCRSLSCVSLSIPGIYAARQWRDRYDRYDDVDAAPDAEPAKPVASAPAQVASKPAAPAPAPLPRATTELAAAATQQAAVPPPPKIQPSSPPQPEPVRVVEPVLVEPLRAEPWRTELSRVETPTYTARPTVEVAPRVARASQAADDEAFDTPVGEWLTERKGSVRIERCGNALCGYLVDPSTQGKGEAVLVNMKPKTGSQWTGNVHSHSGSSYHGTLAMKGPHTLRVEACALGKFYCTGNNWSRIDFRPERQISSRQPSSERRS
jgi:uncharacterized protein (DUF2147 family)